MLLITSAWKSGPKTGEKPRPDQDQTALGPQILRTGKDCNCGPVFGLWLFKIFKTDEKPVSTSLHRSSQPRKYATFMLGYFNNLYNIHILNFEETMDFAGLQL